jgi:DinB superfamily
MAVRLPWWKRRLVRWRFLPMILRGGFPKNAPAPREIRPTGHSATPEEAAQRLTRSAEEFLRRLAETGRRTVRLTHPYFGDLSALQTVQLLTSHARHHQSQLPAETRDNPRTSKG